MKSQQEAPEAPEVLPESGPIDPAREPALPLVVPGERVDPQWQMSVWVPGGPAAQGSKRHVGDGRLVEQSRAVGPWRKQVATMVRQARGPLPLELGAVALRMEFVMPRPQQCPVSTPPAVKRPDGDKLARAVFDALTGVVYRDDSQVVDHWVHKRIAEAGETAGLLLTIGVL